MLGSNVFGKTTFRTRTRGMSRLGTLGGVLGVVLLSLGMTQTGPCGQPPPPPPCTANADCDDTDACTTDACDVATGDCTHTAACDATHCVTITNAAGQQVNGCVECLAASADADCGDSDACNGVETCVAGACVNGTAIDCDDGDACNGTETCDAATGACVDGTALDCDDADLCTDDSCDPATGCVNTETTVAAGCDNGVFCDGTETCDPATGACVAGTDPCDPATEACNETTDTCDPGLACTTNADCPDDGDFCTGTESCDIVTGFCTASGDPCDTAGGETCNEALNTCVLPPGETIAFTLSTDISPATDGTSNDDTYSAPLLFNAPTGTNVPSLQTGDNANGGDGTDTLNAQFNFAGATTVAPTLTNIEILNITDFGTAATTLSGNAITGATSINLSNSTNGNVFTVLNLPSIVSLGMTNQAIGATLSFPAAATSGAANSTTVSVNGLTGAGTVLTLTTGTTNGFETLNLASNTTASSFSDIAMNGTTLTTVNVTGDAALTITTTLDANVTTVNASTATGAVTLTQFNAGAFAFTGGAGNDTITLGASYGTTDVLNGGDGTDTIGTDSATAAAASGAQSNVTNMEALTITDALAAAITPTRFGSGVVTVNLAAGFGGGSMTVPTGTNVTLGARATDPAGTGAGGITVSGSGVTDAVTMTINDCDMGAFAITTTGVETLTIVSNGDLDGSAASGAANVFGGALTMTPSAASERLVVTGATQLTITGVVTADVIDASAFTGALVMGAVSVGATAVTGGSGNDTLYGTAGADVLTGGAGNDTFLGGVGADIITTGTGIDHVSMVVADVGDIITDFTPGSDKFDWNTALSSTDATVTLPTGTGAFQAAAAGTAIAVTTTVFELTGTTVSSQAAANVVTALGASATNADINANLLFVIYTTGGGGAIWNWINTNADVQAGELTLVATFSTLTADSIGSGDFE